MAPIPYLLYFPMTDFSFSLFNSSTFFSWLALVVFGGVALSIMIRELRRDIDLPWDDLLIGGRLEAYRLFFIARGDRPSVDANEHGGG